jgi:DNA-binding NarL/FixJ family response regulator
MPDNPKKPSFIIADIQSLAIEGLRSLLKEKYDFRLNVYYKSELLKALEKYRPEFLIIDTNNIDFGNPDDLKKLRLDFPATALIVLTGNITQKDLATFRRAGIYNILHKYADSTEILQGIDAALRKKKYYSGYILDLMNEFNENNGIPHENTDLTASEKEIIALIGAGLTTKEIARKRSVSFHTIMTHRKNVFRKTGVSNVSELIIYAIKNGIIDVIDYQI